MDKPRVNFTSLARLLPDCSPCDSPIEDIFYWEIQKYLSEGALIKKQHECQFHWGSYWIDFLITLPHRKLGFECDGKDYHRAERDGPRDKSIVEEGHADRIFRLRGKDIYHRLADIFDLIRALEPNLFSERGHDIISRLSTPDIQREDFYYSTASGFPFVALREFEIPDGDSADDEDSHTFPVVIYWTENKNRAPK